MKLVVVAIAAVLSAPAIAAAQDTGMLMHEGIGLPMKPSDAAGGHWLLQTKGRTICRLRLGCEQTAPGVYGASIPGACGEVLPPGLVGWKPVADGLALVGADGRSVVDFNQWTPAGPALAPSS
jgi:hypothetical protein